MQRNNYHNHHSTYSSIYMVIYHVENDAESQCFNNSSYPHHHWGLILILHCSNSSTDLVHSLYNLQLPDGSNYSHSSHSALHQYRYIHNTGQTKYGLHILIKFLHGQRQCYLRLRSPYFLMDIHKFRRVQNRGHSLYTRKRMDMEVVYRQNYDYNRQTVQLGRYL